MVVNNSRVGALGSGQGSGTMASSSGGFDQFLTGAGNVLGDIFGGVQQIGSAISPAMPAIAGSLLTKEAYDRLSNVGDTAYQRSMDLAERGQQESQFRPFTVTTPTGSMFTSRMGGQPRNTNAFIGEGDDMMTVPPEMIEALKRLRSQQGSGSQQTLPPPSELPLVSNDSERFNRRMPLQPVTGGPFPPPPMMTGGPVAPGFTPVLRSGVMPGTVMDGGGAFESITPVTNGQEFNRRMEEEIRRLNRGMFGQTDPEQTLMQQPTPQPQDGLEIGMSLSPAEQAMYQGLFGGAGNFFGQAQQPTAGREQEIFNRIRAAQMPEEQRQRLALEERLAAQGRLGTSSAAYGGATPEMLAMATAQEEGRNRAMLGAMQQAQAEQMQQAALGQQFLGSSYLPQQQLLAALQPGLTQQQMAQQAQQFGTGLFGETAMSGIESKLIAEQARANLLGGIGSNILSGLMSPQFNKDGDLTSPGGFGSSIEGFADLLTKLFGK
tara:strand:- start:1028 stop:2503 length:1476 start_codon:yes stop_codon:yes gene_type:complete